MDTNQRKVNIMTEIVKFTQDDGNVIEVPKSATEVVSNVGSQTVYAYANPGGKTMLSVRYNGNGNNYVDGIESTDQLYDSMDDSMDGDFETMNTYEEARSNPGKLFTWRNLRLQSAISGEKAVRGRVGQLLSAPSFIGGAGKRFLSREISAKSSIRDSLNIMMLTTTEDWATYVRHMADSPIDMGAELSASVTPSQQISVAKFVAEWERDPGHASLRRKAVPGSDINELIGKGDIVYRFMTGRGPNPASARGYGTFQYDKMFKLAYDIISSMPLNTYNSYTLFKMLDDEGENAYREAVDTYVALEISEVGMVLEIRDKLAEIGPGYANMVINNTGAAAEAGLLMEKAVSAYAKGDTSRVRSILGYLQESPFYYASPAGGAKNVFDAKSDSKVVGLQMKVAKAKDGLDKYVRNGIIYISGAGLTDKHVDQDGKFTTEGWGKAKDKSVTVHKSVFDDTSVGVLKFGNSKEKFSFSEGAILPKGGKNQNRSDHAIRLKEAIAPNPAPKGRGKEFYVQIHPKNQLTMTRRPTNEKGRGDMRHGKSPKKGQNYWTKGLYRIMGKMIEKDNAKYKRGATGKGAKRVPELTVSVKAGILKSTGEEAPYYVKLPKHLFRVVTHPQHGYKTLSPRKDKSNKEFTAAYTEFLKFYGIPKLSPSKDIHFRFVIPKAERGTYYDAVRRKAGDAKRSR
jgi:hypothetical protein